MAYKLAPNTRGGFHVSDEETLAHGEVASTEEAKDWFEAQDTAKREAWEAANAAPTPGAQPVNSGDFANAVDVMSKPVETQANDSTSRAN